MPLAALYDIHGNLPALESVLDEVGRADVDAIVVGGDVVPGPMVVEVLRRLRQTPIPTHFLRGNGEREVLALRDGREPADLPDGVLESLRWIARELAAEQADWIGSWPATIRLPVVGLGEVLFCHATPRSDSEIFTRLTPVDSLRPAFEPADAPVVVCGHTHMPFDRTIGSVRVVNAGSVGMPFGEPGGSWLLLGPDVEHRRASYDLEAAADRIRRTAYPHAQEFADRHVLHPMSEEEALEAFGRAAAG